MEASQLRHRVTTKTEESAQDVAKVKYSGPPLRTFQPPRGLFLTIWWMLFMDVFRMLSGVMVEGYRMRFRKTPAKEGEYKVPLSFFGKQITETTNIIPTLNRPKEPIVIYDFEACPYCKKVREAATRLDLDILFYPTPEGAPVHRPRVKDLGGKEQFPFMIDPNTGTSMYESDAIVEYLYKEYGTGRVPWLFRLGILTTLSFVLASVSRSGRGQTYRKAKYPDQPLIFWGYDGSPFSRLVREVLVELELPFLQIYCARGSPKRQEMMDKVGAFQAPFIEDPNTGTKLFESVEIIKYLEETYAL